MVIFMAEIVRRVDMTLFNIANGAARLEEEGRLS
jgi:hypothetical protein